MIKWLMSWIARRKQRQIAYCDLCKYCHILKPFESGVCTLLHPIMMKVDDDNFRHLAPKSLYCDDYDEE